MPETVDVIYDGPHDSVDVLDWTSPGERYIVLARGVAHPVPELLARGGHAPHATLDDDGQPIGSPFAGLLEQDAFKLAKPSKRRDTEPE